MSNKKQTAMQDLKQDLLDNKISAKETLNEIYDKELMDRINFHVQITLDNIIERIDDELLELEKQQIKTAFRRGEINEINGIENISSEQYYTETYEN